MDTKKKAMLASFFIIIVLAAGISLLYFRFQPVPEENQNQNPEHYITMGAEITDVVYPSIEVPNSEIIASVYIIDEYGDEGRVSIKKEYTKLHDAAGNTLTDADLAAGQKIEMVVLNSVIYEPVQTFYDCQEITEFE